MTRLDHDLVSEIFLGACDLERSEREAYLRSACGHDGGLRTAVEKLLAADDEGADLLSDVSIESGRHVEASMSGPMPADVAGFTIIREIGRGGMGVVYEAQQTTPDRLVALKVINPMMAGGLVSARFRREMQVLGRLQHVGIAQVYEAGDSEDRPYIAMELIDGTTVRSYAEAHGLDVRAKLELIARVSDAVHHAHQKGVIHRDLKPDNVLVTVSGSVSASPGGATVFAGLGQPKILDFGVARLVLDQSRHGTIATTPGQIIGTIAYMSPEQIDGTDETDIRTDVYAIGVMAYELISGALPLDLSGLRITEAAMRVRDQIPVELGALIPAARGDASTIVMMAMAKEMDRRYTSAAELAADIRRSLSYEPISARRPSLLYHASRLARRNLGLVAGLGAAACALVAGMVLAGVFAISEASQRRIAEAALYQASMEAVSRAAVDMDGELVSSYLQSAPEAWRGWEWDHFASRVEPALATRAFAPEDSPQYRVGRSSDGSVLVVRTSRQGEDGVTYLGLDADSLETVWEEATDGTPGAESRVIESRGVVRWPKRDRHSRQFYRTLDGTGFDPTSSQDIEVVYRGKGAAIMLREQSTGSVLHEWVFSDFVRAFDVTPDGATLLTGHLSGLLRAFDTRTYEELAWSPMVLDTRNVSAILTTSSDTAIAGTISGRLFWIDTVRGEILSTQRAGTGQVLQFVPSKDGSSVYSASRPSMLRRWSTAVGDPTVLSGHALWVNPLAITPDGTRLVSGAWDGTVRVWDAPSGALITAIDVGDSGGQFTTIHRLAIQENGHDLLVSWGGGTLWPSVIDWYDLRTGELVRRVAKCEGSDAIPMWHEDDTPHVISRTDCEAIGDAQVVLTKAETRQLRIVSSGGAAPARLMAAQVHPIDDALIGVTFPYTGEAWSAIGVSPDQTKVAGAARGLLHRRLLSTGETTTVTSSHTDSVLSVAWSPDGSRIATGSRDRTIGIWDAESLRLVATLRGHADYIYDLRWSPDSRTLYSSSGDGTVRVWDTVPPGERLAARNARDSVVESLRPRVNAILATSSTRLDAWRAIAGWADLSARDREIARQMVAQGAIEPTVDRVSHQ